MKVPTIYAHHSPHSPRHALLERFDAGLRESDHEHEIVDLFAIGFDPVRRDADGPNLVDDRMPDEVLARCQVRESLLKRARGPMRCLLLRCWLGTLHVRGIMRKIRARGDPADIAQPQRKAAAADALAFVAPPLFVGFPTSLKGWIERVFSLGFTAEAWRGDVNGRLPLLKDKKALVMATTIFDEASDATGLGDAMRRLIGEFALRCPGIAQVQRETCYAVRGADGSKVERHLQRAHALVIRFAKGIT